MALIAVDSVRWASRCPIAGVRPEGGGDRNVAGELRQETRVQRRVVGNLAEAYPCVEHRRADRCAGVVRVGPVHHPDVAAHDPHVEGSLS